MQSDLLLLKRMLLTIVTFTGIALTSQGQIPLTIDKAMEIAQENSPSLRRSYMNLERYKQNLLAQKASLKSRFSLNLNPVDYNKNRRFDIVCHNGTRMKHSIPAGPFRSISPFYGQTVLFL